MTDELTTTRHNDPEGVENALRRIVGGQTEYQVSSDLEALFGPVVSRDLIRAAVAKLHESGKTDGTLIRGWVLEAARDIFRACNDNGDTDGALKALSMILKLAR